MNPSFLSPSSGLAAVLEEIAEEALVHAGEFLTLLGELAPGDAKLYAKGATEVEEKIKKAKLSRRQRR